MLESASNATIIDNISIAFNFNANRFYKPPHPHFLSPGLISTCLNHKHSGQWSV